LHKFKLFSLMIIILLIQSIYIANELYDLAIYRTQQYHMNVEYRDLKLLSIVSDKIEELCSFYNIDPVIILAIIEQETNYRWVKGDSGGAIGFMQLHLKTALYMKEKYSLILEDLKINKNFSSEHDLYVTPVRTTTLSVLWFIHNYLKYEDPILAIARFNGINNKDYVYSVLKRYTEMKIIQYSINCE